MKVMLVYPQTYDNADVGHALLTNFAKNGCVLNSFDNVRNTELYGPEKMNQLLLVRANAFKPDLLLIINYDKILTNTLLSIDSPKAIWFLGDTLPKELLNLIPLLDKIYYSCKGLTSQLDSLEYNNHELLLGACEPTTDLPFEGVDDYYRSTVNFIGTVKRNRAEMCHQIAIDSVKNGYSFKLWGAPITPMINNKPNMWSYTVDLLNTFHMHAQIFGLEHSYICSDSIVIDWPDSPEMELALPNRAYKAMAAKGLYITKYVKGLETLFVKGKHLEWFNTISELKDLLYHYLENLDEKRLVSEVGYKEVLAKHTYDHRVKQILKSFGGNK